VVADLDDAEHVLNRWCHSRASTRSCRAWLTKTLATAPSQPPPQSGEQTRQSVDLIRYSQLRTTRMGTEPALANHLTATRVYLAAECVMFGMPEGLS
jgi:hypothetical protein